jgi:hypothetical protein
LISRNLKHEDLMLEADDWANYLRAQLEQIRDQLANPVVAIAWPEYDIGLPLNWGTPFEMPAIPEVTLPPVDLAGIFAKAPLVPVFTDPLALTEWVVTDPPEWTETLLEPTDPVPEIVEREVGDLAPLAIPEIGATVPDAELGDAPVWAFDITPPTAAIPEVTERDVADLAPIDIGEITAVVPDIGDFPVPEFDFTLTEPTDPIPEVIEREVGDLAAISLPPLTAEVLDQDFPDPPQWVFELIEPTAAPPEVTERDVADMPTLDLGALTITVPDISTSDVPVWEFDLLEPTDPIPEVIEREVADMAELALPPITAVVNETDLGLPPEWLFVTPTAPGAAPEVTERDVADLPPLDLPDLTIDVPDISTSEAPVWVFDLVEPTEPIPEVTEREVADLAEIVLPPLTAEVLDSTISDPPVFTFDITEPSAALPEVTERDVPDLVALDLPAIDIPIPDIVTSEVPVFTFTLEEPTDPIPDVTEREVGDLAELVLPPITAEVLDSTISDPPTWVFDLLEPSSPIPVVTEREVPDLAPMDIPEMTIEIPTLDIGEVPVWEFTLEEPTEAIPEVVEREVADLSILALDPVDITVPADTVEKLIAPFTWNFEEYTQNLVAQQQERISLVLDGEPVIGEAVFQGIYNEAVGELAVTYKDAMLGAGNEAGMLGELPSEALAARIDLATMEYRKGRQKVALETKRQQAVQWREDMWKAVESAQAFESLWSSYHLQRSGLILQGITAAQQAAVAVHNSNVQWYNSLLEAVQKEINIASENRERAVVKIAEYKARLDARAMDLQASDMRIKAWIARWDGFKAAAEAKTAVFTGQVEAFKAKVTFLNAVLESVKTEVAISAEHRARALALIEDYKARLEARAMDLQASEIRLKIWTGEWDGYKAAAEAKVAVFQGQIQANQAEIDRYRVLLEAVDRKVNISAEERQRAVVAIEDYKARLEARAMDLQASDMRIKAWLGRWEGYKAAADAKVAVFQGQMEGYKAEIVKYEAVLKGIDSQIAISGEERQRAVVAIEDYKARLEARAMDLQASEIRLKIWTGQWDGYKAAADAKVSVFQGEIEAHKSEIERYRVLLEAVDRKVGISAEERQRAQLSIEEHKARLEARAMDLQASDLRIKAWLGRWDGYKAAAEAKVAAFQGQIQSYTAEITRYNAILDAVKVDVTVSQENRERAVMADNYSGTRLADDGTASNSNVPGYESSQLTIGGGELQILTNKGIAYLNNNNQVNSLGVKVNSQGRLQVETTLINPFNGSSNQQGGLWFGLNDQTFLKLVVSGNKIELRREVNDVSSTLSGTTNPDQRITGTIPDLNTSTVRLRLIVDSENNIAEGFYSTDGVSYFNVGEAYNISSVSISDMGFTATTTYAGIFATHRNSSTPVIYSFDDFKVQSLSITPCTPISTLPCEQLEVSLPYSLSFDNGVANTLADKNGAGTGFTMADNYSGTRLADDGTASNRNVPGYEPSQLTISGGELQILTNKGIAYLNNNNQVNSLGVKVNSQGRLQVETSLINPFNGSSNQQGGLWFGLNDQTFLKLVVRGNKIELRREVNDMSSTLSGTTNPDQRITGTISDLNTSTVRLRLIVDSENNIAEGFYSTDGITYFNVGEAYNISSVSISDMGFTATTTYAGIFATHRNSSTPVVYSFDDFKVQSLSITPCTPISTLPCEQLEVSLPYSLSFDNGVANTLADKNDAGTGFTMADNYSGTRLADDGTASNSNVPGYEPSQLTLSGGVLQILTNKGIAYLKNNNQVNSLGVKVNSQGRLQVETTLINPFSGSSNQQGGLWFGLNDKTFLKLVVTGNKIELRREVNDVSSTLSGTTNPDQRLTGTISNLNTSTARLRLIVDSDNNIAEGFYSTDGVSYFNVEQLTACLQ